MAQLFMRYPEGKAKALTFSYDDGVEQDIRFIEILDKNGLRGTFNINSGRFAPEGKVYAPCDATVDMMFTTGHAVSLIADCGAEILIHVGLETVSLEGKPFTVHAHNGDKVKKGQLLIEADLEAIKAAGLPIITPMVICNTDAYPTFNTHVGKNVTNDDVVIELAK